MGKERYFVKCNRCGKKIYFYTNECYLKEGTQGIWCSPECFASTFADSDFVDSLLAFNRNCQIYKEVTKVTDTPLTQDEIAELIRTYSETCEEEVDE